jgi:hypothetical protein
MTLSIVYRPNRRNGVSCGVVIVWIKLVQWGKAGWREQRVERGR